MAKTATCYFSLMSGLQGCYMPDARWGAFAVTRRKDLIGAVRDTLSMLLDQEGDTGRARNNLESLCDQACELAAPILDYEEAATEAGWVKHVGGFHIPKQPDIEDHDSKSWQELCENKSLDPYEWEVFEHWAVSQWLAEKLQAQGERVDTDFAGLSIWARTTTGQSITMDGCIQRIYADMMAPHTLDFVAPGA